jgi:Tol biopolymer transport system component
MSSNRIVMVVFAASFGGFALAVAEEPGRDLRGPYFGQETPETNAKLFAPGLISVTGRFEYALSFSPDGEELFFSAQPPDGRASLHHSRIEGGTWTRPTAVSLTAGAKKEEMEAFFAPDGKHIYFAPYDEGMDVRVWVVEVGPEGWQNPRELGPPVSEDPAFFPTSTAAGALYYMNLAKRKVYRAKLKDGRVESTADAGLELGGHAFVAPDESFVLLDAVPPGQEERDIFVAFRTTDGGWTVPANLGPRVNTKHAETCPSLSSDGQYLFFSRYDEDGGISNIYWISSSVIDNLRGID